MIQVSDCRRECKVITGLTILKLGFFDGSERDESRKPLRLSLFLVDLRPQLISFGTELLGVLLKGNELVPPQIRLGHQEVQATR